MRYSVLSEVYPFSSVEHKVNMVGARNVVAARRCGVIFCDLFPDQIAALQGAGLRVEPVTKVTVPQYAPPTPAASPGIVTMTGPDLSAALQAWQLRQLYTRPPEEFYLIAVLDTGIRSTHESLVGKVLYEEDFSGSGNTYDNYGHGTSVAYMIAGGREDADYSEPQGVSPHSRLLNIKVISDQGEGSDESIVLGIEDVLRLAEEAEDFQDSMHPKAVNMSFGAPDDGNPYGPVSMAVLRLLANSIFAYASAGNDGPGVGTIAMPAARKWVGAIGALRSDQFEIADFSSRGPSKDGNVKPDIVVPATDMILATSESDTAYSRLSGTSFACPLLLGGYVTVLEYALARNEEGRSFIVPGTGEVVGPVSGADIAGNTAAAQEWQTKLNELFRLTMSKPPGAEAPVGERDNTYGTGFPRAGVVAQAFGEDISNIRPAATNWASMMMPMMMMGVMATMMKPMMKMARGR